MDLDDMIVCYQSARLLQFIQGNMNICICWDISTTNGKDQCRGCSQGKVRVTSQWGFILWGPLMSGQNSMTIDQIVVRIFQSGPKWCKSIDQPKERHCHPWSRAVSMSKNTQRLWLGAWNSKPASVAWQNISAVFWSSRPMVPNFFFHMKDP